MNQAKKRTCTLAVALLAPLMLASSVQPETTPTQLPVGHPAVDTPNPTETMIPANPEDVASIEAIIDAYYDSISGPKGEPRDWERFISLFMPDSRLIAARNLEGNMVPFPMSPQDFVDSNRTYFEGGGYYEDDIHREIHEFGSIAQVFSTYASRRAIEDPEPYARGINSLQLMNTGGRWWITSMMWDYERAGSNMIPPRYLPAEED